MGKMYGFNWSFSRAETYRRCQRAFFYEFASKDEPEGYEASRLKQMTTPIMMAGTVADSIIGRALIKFRHDGEIPGDLAQKGQRVFERWWADSKTFSEALRKGNPTPDNALIMLHHYLEEDDDEETKHKAGKRVANCLYNFEQSEINTELQAHANATWGEIRVQGDGKFPPNFDITPDIKLWAAYDLHFSLDGELTILDWKSGRKTDISEAKAQKQLATYALYGHRALGFAPDKIKIQAIWLQHELAWDPTPVAATDIEQAHIEVITEATEVLKKLTVEGIWKKNGKPIYVASREDFPSSPSEKKCANCQYLSICADGKATVSKESQVKKQVHDEEYDPFAD